MASSFSLFDTLLLGIAVYVLVAGIRGKGKLFQVDNIKEGMEEKFLSMSRKLYIWLGITMLINSGMSMGRGLLYTYTEISPATETQAAAYEWIAKYDMGAFSFMSAKVFEWLSYAALAATIGLIVVLAVQMRKYVDKDAAKRNAAANAQANRQQGHVLPVSAFEFDNPEQTEEKKQ